MFESFQNFIPKTARKFTVAKEIHAAYVCHLFRKNCASIFKNHDDIDRYIKPIHFKQGVLLLSAETAGWAQEATFKFQKIKTEINSQISQDNLKIKTVRIKILK